MNAMLVLTSNGAPTSTHPLRAAWDEAVGRCGDWPVVRAAQAPRGAVGRSYAALRRHAMGAGRDLCALAKSWSHGATSGGTVISPRAQRLTMSRWAPSSRASCASFQPIASRQTRSSVGVMSGDHLSGNQAQTLQLASVGRKFPAAVGQDRRVVAILAAVNLITKDRVADSLGGDIDENIVVISDKPVVHPVASDHAVLSHGPLSFSDLRLGVNFDALYTIGAVKKVTPIFRVIFPHRLQNFRHDMRNCFFPPLRQVGGAIPNRADFKQLVGPTNVCAVICLRHRPSPCSERPSRLDDDNMSHIRDGVNDKMSMCVIFCVAASDAILGGM